MDALRDLTARVADRVAVSGDALDDVRVVLRLTFWALREVSGPALSGLMADAQHDQALAHELQSTILGPRRDALRAIIEHGVETGQLRASVDPALVVDMVFGTMWYRLLSHHAPVDDRLADDLVTAVGGLLAPPSRRGR